MLDVVRRTAEACFMPLTVGGGVRTVDDIRTLLRSGADKVSINRPPSANREFVKQAPRNSASSASWSRSTPSGSSARRRPLGDLHPWRAQSTGIDAIEYAQEVVSLGAGEILLTSMDRDGTRQGFDLPLTGDRRQRPGTGDRLRRRRQSRPPGRRHPRGPCHRGAGGLDLPLRRLSLSRLLSAHVESSQMLFRAAQPLPQPL
jgi:hypothetical protein